MDYVIDPEVQSLLVPQTKEEHNTLEALILDGLHVDPGVVAVLNGVRILGDGHNRESICKRHGIPFPVREKKFASREALIQWVIDNQLGRRNLTAERQAYYRGKEYLNKKKEIGRQPEKTQKTQRKPNSDILSELGSTAEQIAEKHGVSGRTIERDAKFAEAVDAIAETQGEEAKTAVLNGHAGQTKEETTNKKAVILCDKCKRTGSVKDCDKCRAERSKADGDEIDAVLDDENNIVPAILRSIFSEISLFNRAKAVLAKAAVVMREVEESEAYRTCDAAASKGKKGDRREYSSLIRQGLNKVTAWKPSLACECNQTEKPGCEVCEAKRFLTVEDVKERTESK